MAQDGEKREYIEACLELLQEGGYDNVSIRKLAEATGRNTATLYRYFDSSSYLIAVASTRLLLRYFDSICGLESECGDALELNLACWERLAGFAMEDIPTYENMFLGDVGVSKRAFREYMRLYPDDADSFEDFLADDAFSFDLLAREKVLLTRAVVQGLISADSVDYLAYADFHMFGGLLHESSKPNEDDDSRRTRLDEFIGAVYRIHNKALLDGARPYERAV